MSISKKIWKRSGFLVKPMTFWYFRKPRIWNYKGLKFQINPDVFFPQLTASTSVFMDYLDTLSLERKNLLDVGTGSGALSIFAAHKGAQVTAIDISEKALENTQINASLNGLQLNIFQSDLLSKVERTTKFEIVVVNPPFYPKNPKSVKEMAWFCGEDFEYFEILFSQLAERWDQFHMVLMILSEDCQFDKIETISISRGIKMSEVYLQKSSTESHTIYRLSQNKL